MFFIDGTSGVDTRRSWSLRSSAVSIGPSNSGAVSMTMASLRGLVELGFALTLGVLLDTFVVRTILLPAAIALFLGREGPASDDRVQESTQVAVSLDVEG